MRSRIVAAVRLVVLVCLEAAAVNLLTGRGEAPPVSIEWRHLGRGLELTAPEDVIVAGVRFVGMVIATWLLASTLLYLLARVTRIGALVRGVQWVTLPAVRKVVDGAVAASVVGGALFGIRPAGAQAPPPTPIVVELATTTTTTPAHAYVPVPAGDTTMGPRAGPPTTAAGSSASAGSTAAAASSTTVAPSTEVAPGPAAALAPPEASPSGWHVHAVVPGENLWTIAEADLARQTGRSVDDLRVGEVAVHWVKVVTANRDRVASGDPSLIYPGESILCPPVS